MIILRNFQKGKHQNIVFTLLLLLLSVFLLNLINNHNFYNFQNNTLDTKKLKTPEDIHIAAQETFTVGWLENPTFDDPIEPTWYSKVEGDNSDVKATSGSGHANLSVIGDSGEMRIDEQLSNSDWTATNNPDLLILPDRYEINSSGCHVSHLWHENINQTRNRPSVHWKRDINMPVNFSDYKITSASLEVIFNATVTVSPHDGGGIDRFGDIGLDDYSTGDYAKFYVLLSDVNETFQPIKVASNNTGDLGQDTPEISNYNDSPMNVDPESVLIDVLTSVLENDGYNFTITLGIDIYCEDNEVGVDIDRWNSLIIRSFNLTFAYEKKIDQFTSVSWNQDGDKISDISDDTVIINEAKLNFKYKIDDNWTESSQNSEIRAFINNNKLTETIKLSKANSSYQVAKIGGFDVTSLIPYETKINLSIQVYLADEFRLDNNITISIDDVYLNITYTVIFSDAQTNLQIFFNGVNKSLNPLFELPIGTDLNITVKYPDDTGAHISGAIVQLSGNLTGILLENEIFEHYSIIINANELYIGDFHFDIVAHKINYETRKISPILTVTKIQTENLLLFLNGEDKTLDPVFDIAIDKLLNITIKYNDYTGAHISGATVFLTGENLIESLNESSSFEQYSIIVNTTLKFSYGINLLTIKATESNYQEKTINPRINVRKIHTIITPVSGSNRIDIRPGESTTIKIYINNTDFDRNIKGVLVTYSWALGDGIFEGSDNEGIYEVIIEDIPVGTHSLIINAFGSDKYNFESIEIIITANRPVEELILFQTLLIIAIVAFIGLGSYFYAYKKILKYPKQVRKVRKYRKTLLKKETPKIDIVSRKAAIDSKYKQEIEKTKKLLKSKSTSEKIEQEKIIKKKTGKSQNKVINNSTEKKSKSHSKVKNFKNKKEKQKLFKNQFGIKLRKIWHIGLRTNKFKKLPSKLFILIIIFLNLLLINSFLNQNLVGYSEDSSKSIIDGDLGFIGTSGQEIFETQLLNKPTFDDPIEPTWYSKVVGDNSDVKATSGSGHANLSVIGDSGIMRIDEQLNDIDWIAFNNPEFPISPDISGSNSAGLYISHEWDEGVDQTRNTPSIHWKKNITMPINMSDYIITSASLEALFNATVTVSPHDGGGIECPGDYTEGQNPPTDTQFGIGDFATFYVLISDIDNNNSFQVAFNKTSDLGQDTPAISNYTDTLLENIPEEILISYLTSAFESDSFNFTITLGIDIYCEDNEYNVDIDTWDLLTIRSFNLTFTYEKKIDQFTSVSWNQDAGKISDLSSDTVIVNEAILNFKYKIDQNWTESSPNSEIRILINENQHPETVKLTTANTTFQEGKLDGFDITPLIIEHVNLSIEVFLADEFSLDRNITISIDDVYLNITYTTIFPDLETSLDLYLNNENKTQTPNIELNVGEMLNITIKYLNKTGDHLPNATVLLSGNFTGPLIENEPLKQYSILINPDETDIGLNLLTIVAQLENFETKIINPIVTINKISSENLQIFLNNQNKTSDPNIELIVSEILNITVRYSDFTDTHITGANVLLTSETLTAYLNESIPLEQYSILINTTERLEIGVNHLTIEAQSPKYQTKLINIRVNLKKINVEITTSSGSNKVDKRPGDTIKIKIILNNTDFGGNITGAIVTYVSELGSGILTDSDNDGIYEMTIPDLSDGTFTITISALAGDQYYIQDFEISLNVFRPEEEFLMFQILMGVGIAAAVLITGYFYAYKKVLKYPKQVRKVRKYRKTLTKEKDPGVRIIDRKISFNEIFQNELGKTSKFLKGAPLDGKILRDKLFDKKEGALLK